jgi:hypothetical protein
MIENTERPAISVDLKKYRIRIHRKTLHSIGDPDYVLLLVNPEERMLAIRGCGRSDPGSNRINKDSLIDKKSFEMYSRFLVEKLRDIIHDWQENQSYRMYGEVIPNEGIVQFLMSDAVQTKED